jgi:hypothetical protein
MEQTKEPEGDFGKWQPSQTECSMCKKSEVLVREWESSDGGHEDYQYKCQNPSCGHSWWVDGVDS